MELANTWSSLCDSIHKAISAFEKKNTTHAEAFFTTTQTTEVTIRNSEIFTQNKMTDSGVGFRVAVGKNKVGFASTNTLSREAILKTGEQALAIAKASSEDQKFALPEPRKTQKIKGLYDSRVAEKTAEDAVDLARRMISAAENFDKCVIAKDGRVIFEHGWRGIINTLGVDFEEQETKTAIYLAGSGEHEGEVTGSCYDFMFKRTADLNPEKIGENVAKMVIEQFKPKPLKSFQGTVIFGPEAFSYQPVEVLIEALKGDAVAVKRSAWAEKIGQKVASELLTVTDNAILEEGFSSRGFDDEGCASQHTPLIRKGKLESFLHNATSAYVLKMQNTGNASRYPGGFETTRMIIGNGYRTKPEIYPSNLIIQQGNKTKEELISETKKGVLIESMAGFPQEGSGIISAQLSRAFYIQNGEIQYPIKGGMVSGVAFDWFQNISGVGEDSKQFQNAIVPSIRVENVKVVGI